VRIVTSSSSMEVAYGGLEGSSSVHSSLLDRTQKGSNARIRASKQAQVETALLHF
jgi:hypothetical protein